MGLDLIFYSTTIKLAPYTADNLPFGEFVTLDNHLDWQWLACLNYEDACTLQQMYKNGEVTLGSAVQIYFLTPASYIGLSDSGNIRIFNVGKMNKSDGTIESTTVGRSWSTSATVYPIIPAGSEITLEYGWTDYGGNDSLSITTVNLIQGWSVAGAWRCVANNVSDGETLTFEWYKDEELISTSNSVNGYSDCKPSADEIGTFSYYCVVTSSLGGSVTSGTMTAVVEADDSGGDGGDSGDGNQDGTVTAEQLKAAYWAGYAAGKMLYGWGGIATGGSTDGGNAVAATTGEIEPLKTAFWRGFAVGCAT